MYASLKTKKFIVDDKLTQLNSELIPIKKIIDN